MKIGILTQPLQNNYGGILTKDLTERPMIFEIFTESKDESDALYTIRNLEIDASLSGKNIVKKIVGDKGVDFLKKIVGR